MEDLCFFSQSILEERKTFLRLDILAFVSDCLQLMSTKNITSLLFIDFNKIWSEHDINLLHECLLEWESSDDYYDIIYEIILEQIVATGKHQEKVILFFLLFAIQQTSIKKRLISLNISIMEQLYFFLQECSVTDQDVLIVLKILIEGQNVQLSSRVGCKKIAIHPCGLPYIVTKRNKEELNKITDDPIDMEDKLTRQQIMNTLINTSEKYHKAKQKNNFQVNLTDQHFAHRSIHTVNNITKI